MAELGEFDGRDVLRTSIAVTNAGDGLSEAMKVDPQVLHLGEKVTVVLECEVAKIRHEPIRDTDALNRVQILRAGTATIIDAEVVKEAIDAQREAIERAKDLLSGQTRFEHELRSEHVLGEHADGLVEHCPLCQEEADAETKEQADELAAKRQANGG